MPISVTSFTMSKTFHIFLAWFDFSSPCSLKTAFCLLLYTSQFPLQCTKCPEKMHPASRHSHIAVYINIFVDNSLGAGGGILNTCNFYGKQASKLLAKIC